LDISGVARFQMVNGAELIVDAYSGVPEKNVRLYLLGSALGALLHQRGVLPLHANAVEIDGKAVAFMGSSGAGKSTLAAWFHDRGFRVIADDVCVVRTSEEGEPSVTPGLPRLRLWVDALEFTGRDATNYQRSYDGNDQLNKFDVPLDHARTAPAAVPLAGLYLLERGEELSIGRLTGVEAVNAVFAHTYRGAYLAATNGQKAHWFSAVRLVRSTPLFRVMRRWHLAQADEQYSAVLDHARSTLDLERSGGNSSL